MPVKRRAVSALVLAETISVLGTRMTYLALPWFVLVTTGSPSKMSLVLAAEILPMAILGIPSGALVQRLGSRTTMLVADFARAPILASIPLLYAAGILDFWLLLAIVALLGAFAPPYFAAQRTILPELVGEDETRMSQANSSIEGGTALAALLGPALAGVLIPFIGAPNVLYVDAATYLVAFVPRPRVRASHESASPRLRQHGVLAGLAVPRVGQAPRPARGDDHGLRVPRRRDVGRAPRVRLRRVRREAPGSPVSSTPRSVRARSSAASLAVFAVRKVAAAPARGLRDPGLLDPAVGASVPAAVAGRVRCALRSRRSSRRSSTARRSASSPLARRRSCGRR